MQQHTIDALIRQLQGVRAEFGNLPVILRDADTGWAFRLNGDQLSIDHDPEFGARLQISARYGDDMEISVSAGKACSPEAVVRALTLDAETLAAA